MCYCRCLKEYDNRVKSHLHTSLMSNDLNSMSKPNHTTNTPYSIVQEHQALLEQDSRRQIMSRLPLVGLKHMGGITFLSMKLLSAFQRARMEIANKFNEVKSLVIHELQSKLSDYNEEVKSLMLQELQFKLGGWDEESNEAVSLRAKKVSRNVTRKDLEIVSLMEELLFAEEEVERARRIYAVALLHYYKECSKRHTAELPLVGLRPPKPAYILSCQIIDFIHHCLERARGYQWLLSFFAHFQSTCILNDLPTFTPLPLHVTCTTATVDVFEKISPVPLHDNTLTSKKKEQMESGFYSKYQTPTQVDEEGLSAVCRTNEFHKKDEHSPTMRKNEGHLQQREAPLSSTADQVSVAVSDLPKEGIHVHVHVHLIKLLL